MTSDEFSDIEQLDENLRKWFKEKWVRFGPDGKIRGACARGSDKEGKPKCLPQSKAHSIGKKGRKYAGAKKRREDPNPERSGKAKNVATKKKTNEDIPFNECPSCRGPIVHESMMNEKQDACYHKVKSRYKVWPSAYASGALVQCRKKGASNWGTGGKKKNESSIMKGIVDEGVIISTTDNGDPRNPQVAVLGGAGSYSFENLKKKALGEAKQLAADIASGEYKNSAYNVKQLANTLNTIVAAEEEMEKLYFGEAVDPKLGYDPDDYDDDFEEIPLQTATHITTQDIPMQGGGDLPAGTELKMHKRSSDPGPDTRARFHFFAVLDNGNPTRLVRLPKKLVKSVTMHEDYTGEFAAEVTPAINPYGGLKDKKFRGAIGEALLGETPTDNPTGASGEGGWRKYKPKSAGTFKEDELEEACWKGYHKEGNKKMFGKTYPNCVKNKKSNEDIEEDNTRVARKPGQPANSKKHSDLYTDENPKGTITGLKFATAEDARASVSKIRNSGRSHAHKIQAAVAMEQRAKAAGKTEAASIYRKYINASKKTNEEQLDEKCWDTHKQVGMKNKGGRQVPNCVPKESAIMKGLRSKD